MTSHKNILSFMILGVSALSLNACSGASMPTGYTYHHQEYKSATPAPSAHINAEQRKYMDATQAEQFRDSVYDLLTKVTMRAGMPPKPVYVLSPDPMTVFYTNIDNDLRESMRTIGYAISDTPNGAYVFTYSAQALNAASAGQPNVELSIDIYNALSANAKLLTHEAGQYYIQGIETLNIQPTRYPALSATTENWNRAAQQASTSPVSMPAVQYQAAPVSIEMEMEPSLSSTIEVLEMSSYRDEPMQAVSIDSSVLEEAPYDRYQTSLPRVSKEVLY